MYFVVRKRADVRDTGPTPVSIGTCNLLVLKRLARAKDHQVFACRRVHGRRRSTSPGRTPGPCLGAVTPVLAGKTRNSNLPGLERR